MDHPRDLKHNCVPAHGHAPVGVLQAVGGEMSAQERDSAWWTASLCALSAATALGLATVWIRVIAQIAVPPPPSIYDDPFLALLPRSVMWGCGLLAPPLLLAMVLLRRRFRRARVWLQVTVGSVLVLGTLYCLTSYALRVERTVRSARTGAHDSEVHGRPANSAP